MPSASVARYAAATVGIIRGHLEGNACGNGKQCPLALVPLLLRLLHLGE